MKPFNCEKKTKTAHLKMLKNGYDTKQSDGDAPMMLELWGMWSTLLLLLLPGPLWPGVGSTW